MHARHPTISSTPPRPVGDNRRQKLKAWGTRVDLSVSCLGPVFRGDLWRHRSVKCQKAATLLGRAALSMPVTAVSCVIKPRLDGRILRGHRQSGWDERQATAIWAFSKRQNGPQANKTQNVQGQGNYFNWVHFSTFREGWAGLEWSDPTVLWLRLGPPTGPMASSRFRLPFFPGSMK